MRTSERGYPQPIPGTKYEFLECPAYYLRLAPHGLPADHLIDGTTHPAHLVSEFAFEVESGSRNVDSLSPKARELVHLWLSERRQRDENDRRLQQAEQEKQRGRRR